MKGFCCLEHYFYFLLIHNLSTRYTQGMQFSWIKNYLSHLFKLLKLLFECTLMVIILAYGMHVYLLLNAPKPTEKTNLVRRFVGQSDSSDSTDLSEYKGSAVKLPDLELSRIEENRYSAVGYGIEVKDWDAYVDQLHLVYRLSPESVATLRLAKFQSYGQFDPKTLFDLDKSSGEGNYLRIISEKKNDKINFVLAGNRVNFHIAPVAKVSTQTATLLWAFSWTKERVDYKPRLLTIGEKEQMDSYFLGRAMDGFVSQNGEKALEYEREYNKGNSAY